MSVFTILKNTSEDLFVLNHPSIKKFKRQSKELHKELKEQNYSLMQCQEIIVKRHGFNSWHHLQQVIKNQLSKQEISKDTIFEENDLNINKNKYLLGYEIINEKYLYQSKRDSSTNRFIYGLKNEEYDMFLMKQMIKNNSSLCFFNGKKDNHIQELSEYARENSIKKVIVFSPENYHFQNNFILHSSNLIISFCMTLFLKEELNEMECSKDDFTNISSLILNNICKSEENNNKTPLTLESILERIEKDEILKKETKISEQLKKIMNEENLLNILNNKKYSQIKMLVMKYVKCLIDLNIFSFQENSVPLDFKDECIYLVDCSDKIKSVFFSCLFKFNVIRKLYEKIEDKSKNYGKGLGYFPVVFRDISFSKGIEVLSAQARSMGFSITYSYSNDLVLGGKNSEVEYIIANCKMRIIHSSNKPNESKLKAINDLIPFKENIKLNDFYYIHVNNVYRVNINNVYRVNINNILG